MAARGTRSILVIGGGAIGLSLAWQLARRPGVAVTLVERNALASGTSWHAAGIIGPLRATPAMTGIAMDALDRIPVLERETGLATGYRTTGGFWIARRPERMDSLHRIAAIGRVHGLTPEILSGRDLSDALPGIATDGISGVLAVAEDGSVNPYDLCMALARAARASGAVIREGTAVGRILVDGGRAIGARLANGKTVTADAVALCAGAWSGALARTAGVALPLQAVEHMYVVTEPMPDLPFPFPVLRDLDRQIYVKGDAGRLVIGGFERDAKPWDPASREGDRAFLELPEDWEQFSPFLEAALELIPGLGRTGIQRFMNGPESFTVDTRPLVGETVSVPGLFVAAGMNSVGIMSSPGIGRVLADWILDGEPREDLWEIDVARVDPRAASGPHRRARMAEAVGDAMAMPWPFRQPIAGRPLRTSTLHRRWAALGAVFGVTAGWERALWHAAAADERDLSPSIGAQAWFPVAEREARALADGVAMIDLTPLARFTVSGPESAAVMARIFAGRIDLDTGAAAYGLMLNRKGGIEADAVVTRIGRTAWHVGVAAGLRWKVFGRLRRMASHVRVRVEDRTESETVIGVAGPASRDLLASLDDDTHPAWDAFPFLTSRRVRIAGRPARATRVSYSGALGWEIHVENRHAGALFDALVGSGASPLGLHALDGCRMEVGFRHWGHDMTATTTPGETGLAFTVRSTGEGQGSGAEFIGAGALALAQPVRRRLVHFHLPDNPLVLHDEPVVEEGRVAGLTTSGARGPRTGMTLAFALIAITPGESVAETVSRRFEVEVAGRLCRAIPLSRPPLDPAQTRMMA